MSRRSAKKTNPNDADELQLTLNPTTGLPELVVVPRTTPIPEKKPRRSKKKGS
jgi:hypothetical protein